MAVITASERQWVELFSGLSVRQFRVLVRQVARLGGAAVADGRACRQWSLPLADRVLLVACYYRTNLTMRQVGPLFGITHSAAGRIIERLGPFLALQPTPRRRGEVLVVDGTLVPTRDRAVGASSKNYRTSVNLQVLINADTRLVVAIGRPLPGNRNDCVAYAESGVDKRAGTAIVIADGGYQGTGLLIPHRRRAGQVDLDPWREEHNASHRRVRARVEHVFARMKCWKILRDCRRRGDGVHLAALAVARMHNLALTS
ncbi:transposase [Longispora fulva]|uniref:DDE superfamily endonuclease n=1 Tax=Longispora fulva TaxID=619741 RepID=A0A8J7KJ48_9ACTN|nr:transposase [Longispora fulva]MBG6136534.1 hypothetical protein [Longispora fulva]